MANIDENLVDQPENIPANPVDQPQDFNMQPPLAAQPRVRRTHKDDFISSLLSKLSLCEKLSKNKEIEDDNKNRELRSYNHHLDPVMLKYKPSYRYSFSLFIHCAHSFYF